jgi:hypothetical protein
MKHLFTSSGIYLIKLSNNCPKVFPDPVTIFKWTRHRLTLTFHGDVGNGAIALEEWNSDLKWGQKKSRIYFIPCDESRA